jgi:hypothetical protein
MKAVVMSVGDTHPVALQEVDIATSRDLEERFGDDIPVLLRQERVIAHVRISVTELLARLEEPEIKTG